MNWDAIGAIGEVVGGVGVIVTLIYLAIQVRQNTAFQRTSTLQGMMEASASLMDLCASDPDLGQLLFTGLDAPESLSEKERFRFGFLMMGFLRRVESVYCQVEIGQVLESEWLGLKASTEDLLVRPGAREWWKENQHRFRQSFALWVSGVVETKAA